MSHRDSYIWFRSNNGGVVGMELDEVNKLIRQWNHCESNFLSSEDFWSWFSFESETSVSGFSALWNDGNPLMSKLYIIAKGV